MFQSRNRDAFLFKHVGFAEIDKHLVMFQSRNRDAFLFKGTWRWDRRPYKVHSFNLVIEMLFFSS